MPMPDFRVRSTSRFGSVDIGGASSVCSAIRSAASGPRPSSRYLSRQASKTSSSSQDNHRRVVRQAVVCAGSLHVRTFKLLWKPAVLQLMVTTTTSLSEDEAHFDDCDDDSDDSDDSDVEKLTTMARPNKTHHYSLVFCYRSLMGHARRERIELDDPRDPVELVWGEDGLLSTQFEFSVVYGSVGPSGRRRNLTCRARDAKEYLQWTEALRTALECQGKNKDIKMNRSTHAHTVSSSKAPSNSRGSIGSFFDLDVVEEQQLLLEREAARKASAHTPTSPTAATAAEAIAPPAAEIARASALKPVPADIAAEYGGVRRRPVSIVVPAPRPVGTRLQRRKPSVPPMGTGKPLSIAPLRRGSVISKTAKPTATLPPFGRPHGSARVDHATTEMSMSLPPPGGQRRRRTSSAARRLSSSSLRTRVWKTSISNGAHASSQANGAWRPHTPDTSSGSKRTRLRVSPTSQPEEKRPRVPSSPLTSAPVLGALPILQSPSSLTDSPLDFIDERPSIDNPRTTEFVNSLVKIAGVASAKQRQKLLHRQRQESCPVSTNYGLPLISRKSEEKEDPWLMSRRSSRLNLDICDVEVEKSTRSNRQRTHGETWAAYLKAMECEL